MTDNALALLAEDGWTWPDDLLEAAWGIIANAGGGDWTTQTPEWQEAAARWRDAYHEHGARLLAALRDEPRLRKVVERTARMGLCSQTHHEHLMYAARAALDEPTVAASEHVEGVGS